MRRFKEWWRALRRAIEEDIDAHVAALTGCSAEHVRLRRELPEVIADLEKITAKLKEIM